MPALTDFRKNVYSQTGEDGIVEAILGALGRVARDDLWCVEFGAWDGVYLSNTCNLIRNKGFKAVMIEGDPKRHRQLCTNFPSPDVVKVLTWVNFEGENTIDGILAKTPIPKDFDLLSIDIDGADYHVWDSIKAYTPKIVIIEFNPEIPVGVPFVQPRNFGLKWGTSRTSLITLGREKGYVFVALTDTNVILVHESHVGKLGAFTLPEVPADRYIDDMNVIFPGFDGTILSNKDHMWLPLHGMKTSMRNIQFFPRFLRKYKSDYNPLVRLYFKLFRWFYRA